MRAIGAGFVTGGVCAVLFLIGSCVQDWRTAKPQVSEVTIVDKHYAPGHYDTSCSTDPHTYIVTCNTYWVPPAWAVQYEDGAERFGIAVSSGTYEALRLGDRKILQYQLGGGYWHARYDEVLLLQRPPAEGTWPVR